MDQNIQNVRNTDQYPEYPVLRLANPLPARQQYPANDNENNMYYEHENDNATFKSTTMNTSVTSSTSSSRTTSTNITNLTGTITNSHPLMHSPPVTSPPVSPDFPDLIPEKKTMSKHTSHHHRSHASLSKSLSQGAKFTFKPEAHSSSINLHKIDGATVFSAGDTTSSGQPHVRRLIKKDISSSDLSDADDTEDNSLYEATLSPNLQNVSLTMAEKASDEFNEAPPVYRRRRISLIPMTDDGDDDSDDDVSSIDSVSSSKLNFELINDLLESSEDVTRTSESHSHQEVARSRQAPEPIEEYSAAEERRDSRHWQKIVLPSGEHRSIDMRVIEPYKRILSHGGYLKAGGHNAIVVFSACFLPDKSRVDYDYVMDNLFLYVLATLDQLVTEDYVLVYLHGGAGRAGRPSFSWIKKCYQLIDRKLRKNLKRLYIVHPTIWVRTLLLLCKPFVSSKFYKKITYVHSLSDLADQLPIEQAAIPDKVKNYERIKFSC